MDWVEFILNNNAALASFIGLGVMVAIVIFMIYYATSHLMKDKAED
jgi:heme/copper-type cytochrome/quinol oxidase subunit 2